MIIGGLKLTQGRKEMTRTQKVVLLIVAISLACMFACGFWYFFGEYILPEFYTDREPTREEWASAPRGDGKYRIGNQAEMTLGRWYTDSNKYGCSWKIYQSGAPTVKERGSGKTVMITNVHMGYFETEGCGTWYMK